ncbi:hypothetical protein DPMN_042068 [Dreissena polymorpha]|uniref:Uncharacterized protein n=1 Tax=Dreissena polymorpha TaxID=45954 RepID=A0A9D4HWQ4_DREPO|nr:hypothetical protein DPMN_042068 [Dreissena polymorpha]
MDQNTDTGLHEPLWIDGDIRSPHSVDVLKDKANELEQDNDTDESDTETERTPFGRIFRANVQFLSFLSSSWLDFANANAETVEFVEESRGNITSFYHWRSEFFLFTIEYLFHVPSGLSYK